jgi:hypothetical protein
MLDIFQSGGPANLARGINPADPGKTPMIARVSAIIIPSGTTRRKLHAIGEKHGRKN